MGGAERTARKRRQQQLTGKQAVARARGGPDRKKTAAVIGVVLLVAAVVIGGVLWTNASKNATEGQTIPTVQPASTDYEVRRDGLVVVSGSADAPTTIDVYADFLCPVCAQFEHSYGDEIERKVAAGELRLRTHMVPLLVEKSDPPGYSLDAANAALLAADAGEFTAYHDSLFAHQPEEGKRGYDKEQLIQLGRDLGIESQEFADGVREGRFDDELTAEMERVAQDPALQQDFGNGQRGFGTPTVVADGRIVDFSDPQWLDKLVSENRG
ncbi:protein-disulfide isomerase [Prauserella shujinwangii]|uniref:Protein-disulfide isomerase n=1 Tax=Prauserella shujinwangii TaxID=1453103 RepID=A0A2T0LKX6_9PSEU|nr:thioredoxin domain-containing protein [Prauserella shujinwangii]PRX43609.1 protein-disulfide isomerase [Prauserella shujinwangii]